MQFITSLFGEGANPLFNYGFALIAVLVLIILCVWLLKFVFNTSSKVARGRNRRLSVIDNLPLDNKRNLILVRRDDVEHLIVIGGGQDAVVETGIPAAIPSAQPAKPKDKLRAPKPQKPEASASRLGLTGILRRRNNKAKAAEQEASASKAPETKSAMASVAAVTAIATNSAAPQTKETAKEVETENGTDKAETSSNRERLASIGLRDDETSNVTPLHQADKVAAPASTASSQEIDLDAPHLGSPVKAQSIATDVVDPNHTEPEVAMPPEPVSAETNDGNNFKFDLSPSPDSDSLSAANAGDGTADVEAMNVVEEGSKGINGGNSITSSNAESGGAKKH